MAGKLFFSLCIFYITSTLFASKGEIKTASYEKFYFVLKPYGEWIEIEHNVIAWRPIKIFYGWKPYLIGRWCWTKHGWYWNSYEPFGWVVYHYGRWYYDDYYGWIWFPDDTWGPAWVEWRYNDFYVGWAPLPPYAIFRIDIGIHFTIKWHSHYSYWNFVRYNYFLNHNIHNYVVDLRRAYDIFDKTKYYHNYYYNDGKIINAGIDRRIIEEKTRIRIPEVKINEVDDYNKINKIRDRNENVYIYLIPERNYREVERKNKFEFRKAERRIPIERDRLIISDDIKRNNDEPKRIEKEMKEKDYNIEKYNRELIFKNKREVDKTFPSERNMYEKKDEQLSSEIRNRGTKTERQYNYFRGFNKNILRGTVRK